MGMSRPSGRQASHRIASAPLRAAEPVQGPARLGAVQAREPAGAAAPVRGRRRRTRGGRGRRFRSRVSACSRDPPGRGRAVRFAVLATSSTPGIIHHGRAAAKFPEGKSRDRERDCGGSKGPKLIKFQRLEGLAPRSEEHTSELQSQSNLVCRLLLEKKKVKE